MSRYLNVQALRQALLSADARVLSDVAGDDIFAMRTTVLTPFEHPVCAAPKKAATASQLDRISSMIASASTLRC
jgi:hypothetical protein